VGDTRVAVIGPDVTNYLIEFAVTDSVVAHDDDVGMLAHRRFTTTPGG
jgi:uroporphyrinogen-III synthase